MDPKSLELTNAVIASQERYEDLQHVFAANGYKKSVVLDEKDAVNGIYKIERWMAEGQPTILVTVDDNDLIEVWGGSALWGKDGVGVNEVVAHLDNLLSPRPTTPLTDVPTDELTGS